jgi:hypothetical protein
MSRDNSNSFANFFHSLHEIIHSSGIYTRIGPSKWHYLRIILTFNDPSHASCPREADYDD